MVPFYIFHQSQINKRVLAILVLLICSGLSNSCQNRDNAIKNNGDHKAIITQQTRIDAKAEVIQSPIPNPEYNSTETRSSPQFLPMKISEVKSWAYQLQGIDTWDAVEALAASPYDLVVIEPAYVSDIDNESFDKERMVSRIKSSFAHDGIHHKLVIAYVNIGQAEDYRQYWTWPGQWDCTSPLPSGWPDFILTCDPDGWEGNYPVAYWDDDWKNIILYGHDTSDDPTSGMIGSIAELLEYGFDGIYMDWVAGFEDEAVTGAARKAGIDPAEAMSRFLQEINQYTRSKNPSFLLIQQNGAALAEEYPSSMYAIDAIAQECTWYCGNASDTWDDPDGYDLPVAKEDTDEIIRYLNRYHTAGLPVFSIDYALSSASEVYKEAAKFGFIAYVSRTSLSNLTTTPPPRLINNE